MANKRNPIPSVATMKNVDRESYQFKSALGEIDITISNGRNLANYGEPFLDLNNSKIDVHQASYGFPCCYLSSEISPGLDLFVHLDQERAKDIMDKLTLIDRIHFGSKNGRREHKKKLRRKDALNTGRYIVRELLDDLDKSRKRRFVLPRCAYYAIDIKMTDWSYKEDVRDIWFVGAILLDRKMVTSLALRLEAFLDDAQKTD